MNGILRIEAVIADRLNAIGFPLHELAAENILAAIRLDELSLPSADAERRLLAASIAAGRSGLFATAEVAA